MNPKFIQANLNGKLYHTCFLHYLGIQDTKDKSNQLMDKSE